MPKIEASERRVFRVKAPIAEVYNAFIDPEVIAEMSTDLERYEVVNETTVRWIYKAKREKGITFQADTTLVYDGNGTDSVKWHHIAGNVDSDGSVKLRAISEDVTEINFSQTIAPDLPIPKLMVKIFRKIVSREVGKDIGAYLDRVQRRFGRA